MKLLLYDQGLVLIKKGWLRPKLYYYEPSQNACYEVEFNGVEETKKIIEQVQNQVQGAQTNVQQQQPIQPQPRQ